MYIYIYPVNFFPVMHKPDIFTKSTDIILFFMILLTLIKSPTLSPPKHIHIITQLLQCLTVGTIHSFFLLVFFSHTFPSYESKIQIWTHLSTIHFIILSMPSSCTFLLITVFSANLPMVIRISCYRLCTF